MKKSNLILLGALAAIVFFSLIFQLSVHSNVKEAKANQKPVEMISKAKEITAFTGIQAEGDMRILFTKGTEPTLEVNAPDYAMDSIKASVSDKILDISLSAKLKKKDSIIIQITNPELQSLSLGSDVHFETVGEVSGTYLHLRFTENSSGNLNLNYDSLKHENNSSGTIILNGKVTAINLSENKVESKNEQ